MRHIPFYIITTLLVACLTGCNSKDGNTYYSDVDQSDVTVTSFTLAADDSVLANLDSVFFAIDLQKAQIYNPDSLPKGTRVNRLVVSPVYSAAKEATITFKNDNGKDTTINLLTNATDSINFENGPAKLHMVSLNGFATRDYTISVNVHKVDPDLLCWNRIAMRDIPGSTSSTANFGFAMSGDNMVGLLADGASQAATAVSADSTDIDSDWRSWNVQLPANARLNTLAATADKAYMVAGSQLYAATPDNLSDWTSCGVAMDYIYGVQDNTVLGAVRHADGAWYFVNYPGGEIGTVPEDCPVEATSQLITFSTEWSMAKQSVFTGGRTASGNVTGAAWAYDGNSWACISMAPIPAVEGLTLVPYFAFQTSSQWVVTKKTVLLAFGGRKAEDGSLSAITYISYDQGVHWHDGGENIKLPDYVNPRTDARAFVFNKFNTILARGDAAQWTRFSNPALPFWYQMVDENSAASRAVAPITEWETPYIYIVGGFDNNGAFVNEVWRGAVNRLIFKPLY